MTPEELIAARERLGMTRRELGEAVGLAGAAPGDTVGKWELGTKRIPQHRAEMVRALVEGRPIPEAVLAEASASEALHRHAPAAERFAQGDRDAPALRGLAVLAAGIVAIGGLLWGMNRLARPA
jgi:hypothetical protein